MVCEYDFSDGIMRVKCTGCIYGANIEDNEACMAKTIDKLIERRDVEKIILSGVRDTEYDYDQVKILADVANAYSKIMEQEFLRMDKVCICGKHEKRLGELQFLVFQILRKDPIGAYVKLDFMIFQARRHAEGKCSEVYIDTLEKMKAILENMAIITLAKPYLKKFRFGDRSIYREIFHPTIKPAFMHTRFITSIPKDSKLIEKYYVAGNTVEIYRVPGKTRYLYVTLPEEAILGEDKAVILDAARKYLAEHKPREAELTEPEKAREIFMRIGSDLVRSIAKEMEVPLTLKEINELAAILTRYTVGFGVLELLLADEKIQDIFINSPVGLTPIYIYHSDFEECETNLIPTKDDAEAWATRFRLYSGRPLDEANPVLDTEMTVPGGRARVCAITRTLSPEGLAYAFRRHRERPWTFPLYINVKMFDPLYAGLMSFIVDGGRAILIAGGRGSGKTSLLGSLMLEIMRKTRICVVEDTLELPVVYMRQLGYNIERMKSRSVITRVEIEVSPEEALRTALRLGDSSLIVGEVRSKESIALFEAMRIGALANVVAGTIHGESCYGVYDRVVHDLGVPPTSFKALDLITICNLLRSPDGLHRFRRVTELTEVRKKWKSDPMDEGGFVPLMQYSAKEDRLKPTDVLLDGESEILNEIAKRVREWHGAWDLVWDNILLRGKIKQAQVEFAKKLKRPEILEADWVCESNEMFHIICDEVRAEVGALDSKMIYEKWLSWYKEKLKSHHFSHS